MNLSLNLSTETYGRPRFRRQSWALAQGGRVWYWTFSFGPLWVQLDNEAGR